MHRRGVGGVADGEQLAEGTRTLQGYVEIRLSLLQKPPNFVVNV